MAETEQVISPETLPNPLIVIMRSDTGFNREMLQALAKRFPDDTLMLCLEPGKEIEFIDEAVMNKAGWFRKPRLIIPASNQS